MEWSIIKVQNVWDIHEMVSIHYLEEKAKNSKVTEGVIYVILTVLRVLLLT